MMKVTKDNYISLINKATNYENDKQLFNSLQDRYSIDIIYVDYTSEKRIYFTVKTNNKVGLPVKFDKSVQITEDTSPYDLICFYKNSMDSFITFRDNQRAERFGGLELLTLEKEIELARNKVKISELTLGKEVDDNPDGLFTDKFESTEELIEQ